MCWDFYYWEECVILQWKTLLSHHVGITQYFNLHLRLSSKWGDSNLDKMLVCGEPLGHPRTQPPQEKIITNTNISTTTNTNTTTTNTSTNTLLKLTSARWEPPTGLPTGQSAFLSENVNSSWSKYVWQQNFTDYYKDPILFSYLKRLIQVEVNMCDIKISLIMSRIQSRSRWWYNLK